MFCMGTMSAQAADARLAAARLGLRVCLQFCCEDVSDALA